MANKLETEKERSKELEERILKLSDFEQKMVLAFIIGWYRNDPEFNLCLEQVLNIWLAPLPREVEQ